MILCHLSIRNIVAILYAILLQLTLALALPTGDYTGALQLDGRSSVQPLDLPSKREEQIDESSIPKIAGGAFGIVALGLIFGLGSASIAVFGSIEWQTRRDKKRQEKGQLDPEKKLDDSSSEKTTTG
jgi:hypothetical protein